MPGSSKSGPKPANAESALWFDPLTIAPTSPSTDETINKVGVTRGGSQVIAHQVVPLHAEREDGAGEGTGTLTAQLKYAGDIDGAYTAKVTGEFKNGKRPSGKVVQAIVQDFLKEELQKTGDLEVVQTAAATAIMSKVEGAKDVRVTLEPVDKKLQDAVIRADALRAGRGPVPAASESSATPGEHWEVDDSLAQAMGLYDDADLLALAPSAPATAPTKAQAAPATAKPAKPAKPVPIPSTDEPSQHATWPEVAAATSQAGKDELDIAWIDALPAQLRDSIDNDFSTEKRDVQVQRATKRFDREAQQRLKKDKAALRRSVAERLSPQAPKKVSSQQIEADPDYQAQLRALNKDYRKRVEAQRANLEHALDTEPRAPGKPNESLVEPPTQQISRLEGVARSRTDFMSWGIEITGSAEKVKAHYQSIQQVPGRPGLWLAADASARLAAAVAAFEAANPGYTIGSSGGHAMRKLHQNRKGLGMHGHSLGLAVDIFAYDNPNLDAPDSEPAQINHFFLKRFGRDDHGNSRATMNLGGRGNERIETLGKHTMAGATTADDESLVQTLRTQFAEISGTSQRFQASIAAHLPLLREARNKYFRSEELKSEIALLDREIAKLEKQPHKADELAAKTELRSAKAQALASLSTDKPWQVLLTTAFSAWAQELQNDRAPVQENYKRELAKDSKGAPAIYLKKELDVLDAALDKLKNPKQVFGIADKQADGTYASELRATELPLMQYIERGSIRDDAMPATTDRKRKGVFNAEVVAVLGRFGFAPGSTFGDTMHFDFIEGYTSIAPGGRNRTNMQPDRYGPRGTIIREAK
jgi:hypothetical protein